MTEMQAALGITQMNRLDCYVTHRHLLAKRYDQLLSELPIITPKQHLKSYSAFHLYVIRLNLDKISKSQVQVFEELRERSIGVNLHYIPVHTQPYFQKMGFKQGDFPNAEAYYKEAISLPIYQGLSFEQQDEVIGALHKVLSE
jgi:dTDP-4-amino-4,6-dideoxygalactose transaminase